MARRRCTPASPRNRCYDWECGDAAATARAIAAAAHVTRLTLLDNRLVTCFLEPRAALAEWDAAAERYTLHASLQSVHALALNLARILRVPTERVRCVTADVGGGFGSKIQPYPEYAALAWAARRVGRPLKWVSSRTEGFLTDAQSRDHVLTGELALDASGHVTALRVHSTQNLGAYVATGMPISIILNMERMVSGLYAIPAIHLRLEGAFTNTVPINVYRGVGRLECVYTVERLIERAARETGRDGVALRRLNMVRTFPYRTATGAIYDSGDYVARLDEALELADAARFPERREDSARRGKLRGIGVGPYVEGTGGVPREYAEVRVLPTGLVEVPIGSQSQGQGHETVFAQVVAERLGVPFETVRIVMGDTDRVADGVGTFASRSMVRGGSAAVEAIGSRRRGGSTDGGASPRGRGRRHRVPRRRVQRSSGPTGRSGSSTSRGPPPRGRCRPRSAPRSGPRRCTRIGRSRSRTAARCASSRSIRRPAPSRSPRGRWSTTPAAR